MFLTKKKTVTVFNSIKHFFMWLRAWLNLFISSNNEILGAEDLRGERYLEVLSEILATASPLPSTAGEVVRCAQGHAQLLLPAPRNSRLV